MERKEVSTSGFFSGIPSYQEAAASSAPIHHAAAPGAVGRQRERHPILFRTLSKALKPSSRAHTTLYTTAPNHEDKEGPRGALLYLQPLPRRRLSPPRLLAPASALQRNTALS